MKKFCILYATFVVAMILNSCANNEEPNIINNENCTDFIEVPLTIVGEIFTEESPLSRASSDDLLGIQVYYKNGSSWSGFSSGLFDDMNNIKVNLLKDYTYKIEATIIKDGKNILYSYLNNGVTYYSSAYPFYNAGSNIPIRDFLYVYMGYAYFNLSDNKVRTKTETTEKYPKVDRLYGEIVDYNPQPNPNTPINLEMKRVSFGVKVTVNGLEEGSINFKLYNKDKTLFDVTGANNSYSSETNIWQCSSVRNAHDHPVGFFDKFTLKVDHKHSIIDITEELGTLELNLYRNKINIINIDLQASSRSNDNMKVSVEYEDM